MIRNIPITRLIGSHPQIINTPAIIAMIPINTPFEEPELLAIFAPFSVLPCESRSDAERRGMPYPGMVVNPPLRSVNAFDNFI
jgi:hypothetical protein